MGRADAVHRHYDGTGTHVVADGAGPHCVGYQIGDSPFQGAAALTDYGSRRHALRNWVISPAA